MNTSRKVIFAIALALNLAAIGTTTAVIMHRHAMQQANTIRLDAIVVTPADAENSNVDLGAIVVMPSEDDWRYAQAHGVQRPVMKSIALAPIRVQPTSQQLAEVASANARHALSATQTLSAENSASASVVETLEAFLPRQYLDTSATLRVLNALVFERTGS